MKKAKFVKEIMVTDPDTGSDIAMEVYKHESGGMFAIDSSYLEQVHDEDSYPVIADPFSDSSGELQKIMLTDGC